MLLEDVSQSMMLTGRPEFLTESGMVEVQRWKITTLGEARRRAILGSSPIAQAIPSFPEPEWVVAGVVAGVVDGLVLGVLEVELLGGGEALLLLLFWSGGFVGWEAGVPAGGEPEEELLGLQVPRFFFLAIP
jgi:hypothetical protein